MLRQQFPQQLGPGLVAGLMGVDQFPLQVRTAHGVIDIVVFLLGLPEIVYRHAAGVRQHIHIRDLLLAALFTV